MHHGFENVPGVQKIFSMHFNTYVKDQICFQINFDLTYIDSQFPLPPRPRRQKKLRIDRGSNILTQNQKLEP